MFPRSSHCPFWEESDAFNSAIAEFVGEVARSNVTTLDAQACPPCAQCAEICPVHHGDLVMQGCARKSAVCNGEQVGARVEEEGLLLDEASAPSCLLSNNRGSRASNAAQVAR